jgi:PAS domain S-box-containing protein
MAHTHKPVKTISDIKPGDHLCCIYSSEDEHRSVITQYLRAGLEHNEKVFYILDARTRDVLINYLKNDGIDVEEYLKKGQLSILTITNAYMEGGVFDPERMIRLLTSETRKALDEGYSALRVTGEMSWALRGLPGSERLIEYENKLNTFFPGSSCLAICQYDRRCLSAEILLNILMTHPFAFIGANLYDNFYYIPPENLMKPNQSEMMLDRWITNLVDRKNAELELRESELLFRKVFNNANDAVFLLERIPDGPGRYLLVNDKAVRTLGYSKEEFMEMSPRDIVPVDIQKKVMPDVIQKLRKDGHATFESEHRRKDGSVYPVEVSTHTFRYKGKDVDLSITRDITGRRQAEKALRESEVKFHSLFVHMIEGAALHELTYNDRGAPDDYVIIETNPAFEMQLGISRDAVIGKTSRDAYSVAEPPYLEIYTQVALKGEPKVFETYFAPLDKHFSISSFSPYKGSFVTFFEDITERKRVELERVSFQNQLKEAHRLAHIGVWDWVMENDTVTWSEELYNIAGRDPSLPAPTYAEHSGIFTPASWDRLKSAVSRALSTGEPYNLELEFIRPDGSIRGVNAFGGLKKDENGKVIGLHGTLQDITERIRIEEALQQANKKLNLLSSITRHDILNGVAVLGGYLELARDEVQNPKIQEYFGLMDQVTKSIQHQIEFTREYQEIGLNAATWQDIGGTVRKAGSLLKAGGITLTISCEKFEIFADPLLQRVFYNLFDNALRYAPPFTTIMVTCNETKNGLSVVFADDGVGISAEEKMHLFERGSGKHTGLGLFLSREILEITGIAITENGAPGAGARFEMTVPKGAYRATNARG